VLCGRMAKVTNAALNATVLALTNLVTALTARIESLENELNKPKTSVASSPATTSKTNWASHLFRSKEKPSVEYQNVVNATKIELRESNQKKGNIMIFGLEPSKSDDEGEREDDDNDRVDEILSICGMKAAYEEEANVHKQKIGSGWNFVSVRRVKTRNGKTPPIVVEMKPGYFVKREEPVNKILKNANKLKNTEKFKGVFLTPDLTLLEREVGKQLRDERNRLNTGLSETSKAIFRYGIRGNQVVKIYTNKTN
jgi:hypothetical protein